MAHITADEALLARLGELLVPVEIRDGAGKVLGHYTPVLSPEKEALYEKAKGLFDIKEVERRLREEHGKGIPLAEFWKKLEAQEKR